MLPIPQSEGVWTETGGRGVGIGLESHLHAGAAHCPASGSGGGKRKQAGVWGAPQKWAGVLLPSSQTGPALAKFHKFRSFLTATIETEKNLWFC